jgi:hypothetical protein
VEGAAEDTAAGDEHHPLPAAIQLWMPRRNSQGITEEPTNFGA